MDGSKYNVTKTDILVNKDIESLIRAEVFKKQVRIKDFFYDFDRLRKGHVTDDKVNTWNLWEWNFKGDLSLKDIYHKY